MWSARLLYVTMELFLHSEISRDKYNGTRQKPQLDNNRYATDSIFAPLTFLLVNHTSSRK